MEATASKPMHIGRKISRIRELRGLKQEFLAAELGISQQAVSKLEQSEVIDGEVLGRIAKALGVSAEAIENFNEETVINNIQNNYDHAVVSSMVNYNFNPIDKIMELYDSLLKSEREKVEMLKEQLKNQNKA